MSIFLKDVTTWLGNIGRILQMFANFAKKLANLLVVSVGRRIGIVVKLGIDY